MHPNSHRRISVPDIVTNAKATLHEMKSKNLLGELCFTKTNRKGFVSTCVCAVMGDCLEMAASSS